MKLTMCVWGGRTLQGSLPGTLAKRGRTATFARVGPCLRETARARPFDNYCGGAGTTVVNLDPAGFCAALKAPREGHDAMGTAKALGTTTWFHYSLAGVFVTAVVTAALQLTRVLSSCRLGLVPEDGYRVLQQLTKTGMRTAVYAALREKARVQTQKKIRNTRRCDRARIFSVFFLSD